MITVRPLADEDRAWGIEVEHESWGDEGLARRGELVDPTILPGLVALVDGERAGLLRYDVRGEACEVVTLRSLREGIGVGRALLDAARETAAAAGCRRLWLVTTNDNLRALGLYQRWGMTLTAFRRDAVNESRKTLKPSISERAQNGIPIEHEFELELLL
jgi:ribosomal protein S18 acetylase RimI-like enzyme